MLLKDVMEGGRGSHLHLQVSLWQQQGIPRVAGEGTGVRRGMRRFCTHPSKGSEDPQKGERSRFKRYLGGRTDS